MANPVVLPIDISITKVRGGYDFSFDGNRSVVDERGNLNLKDWEGRRPVIIEMTIVNGSTDKLKFVQDTDKVIHLCKRDDAPSSGCPPAQIKGTQFAKIRVKKNGTVLKFKNARTDYLTYVYGLYFVTSNGDEVRYDPQIENGDENKLPFTGFKVNDDEIVFPIPIRIRIG